jgi:Rod binding domain-containing protein
MSDMNALGTGIPLTAIPADVRAKGTDAQDAYKAALGFEQMLVKQLTKSLSESSAFGAPQHGDDGAAGPGAPAAYRDMVADQMASSITNAGGIGIAANLYETLYAEKAS